MLLPWIIAGVGGWIVAAIVVDQCDIRLGATDRDRPGVIRLIEAFGWPFLVPGVLMRWRAKRRSHGPR